MKSRSIKKKRRIRSTKIEIGKLTCAVTKEHVLEIFSAYGRVRSLDIASEPSTGASLANHDVLRAPTLSSVFQHAYVEYESHSDASRARKFLNGGMIDRQEITVEIVPKKSHKSRHE